MNTNLHPEWLSDPALQKLIAVFTAAGVADEVRFVGGCVRNTIMGIPIKDVDIATTLRPQEVDALFVAGGYRTEPTGIDHGTVTAIIDHSPFEITTLRRDVETDGRRAVIEFTDRWEEDAERRDFRCNAIYMDVHGRVHEIVPGSMGDAQERRLVFVGSAEQRIREDYLRILRLFRFQATLGATADDDALMACCQHRAGITGLSGERIDAEFTKIMSAEQSHRVVMSMATTSVLPEVIGITANLDTLANAERVTTNPYVRIAALFNWDVQGARAFASRLKMSNEARSRLLRPLEAGPLHVGTSPHKIREAAYRSSETTVRDRLLLTWATDRSGPDLNAALSHVSRHVFPLRGQDLLERGVPAGREMGQMLRALEDWWVQNDFPAEPVLRDRMERVIVA